MPYPNKTTTEQVKQSLLRTGSVSETAKELGVTTSAIFSRIRLTPELQGITRRKGAGRPSHLILTNPEKHAAEVRKKDIRCHICGEHIIPITEMKLLMVENETKLIHKTCVLDESVGVKKESGTVWENPFECS